MCGIYTLRKNNHRDDDYTHYLNIGEHLKMKTRNQRQRKKLHLAEFQELGFLVNWQFC